MALSLSQTQAVNELANQLYSFLPGKAHPFADKSISFEGIGDSLSLRKFWPGGSKLPAISKLLSGTLQYQCNKFCPLLLEIVRKAMVYRQSKNNPITREEIERLNELIARIGFKIPELRDPKFLGSLPREYQRAEAASGKTTLPDSKINELRDRLLELSSFSPQKRGFQFEKFLTELFEAFGMAPRGSFRLVGEQIEGSLQFQGETYLVEAKWEAGLIGQKELLVFSGKVGGKSQWSRGLLISYSGFSSDGLEAFSRGKPTNIVCMDAFDLYCILEGKLTFPYVLERKVRRAAETNEAFVSVKELFPGVSIV